ncbi:hypothetical protein AVEN_227136-1 [Araneus ventricosus]|uniref:Uncharacterized protein n=1 Tax=Araneus ventricosus TaxID=182803 RepID=A0A4Y2BVW1_ARAVE|nr:hypothetical protein AVEN_227136-1 [Araneus ventricosus]
MQLNGLKITGCDETNVNTGKKRGIIRLMELDLNTSLQWCICLLHTSELSLRHLLNSLDGATTGPTKLSRPIRKAIKTCEDSISVKNMPDNIDRMVLSNDQQYLYDICLAISRGECYSDLALRKSGPVAHSRWLTTAGKQKRRLTKKALYSWQWEICFPLNTSQEKARFFVEPETPFLDKERLVPCALTEESRFSAQSNYRRINICKVPTSGASYHPSNKREIVHLDRRKILV